MLGPGQGNPHALVHAEWLQLELTQARGDLVGRQGHRSACDRARERLAFRGDHQRAGAVATEDAQQAEGIVFLQAEVVGEHAPRFAFGQQAIEEGADLGVPKGRGADGQRDGEQRRVDVVRRQRGLGVTQAQARSRVSQATWAPCIHTASRSEPAISAPRARC